MADETNLNFAECIKETSDFGVTHVHNVCSGTLTHLQWGSADWTTAVLLCIAGVVVIGLFASLAVSMIRL